MDTENDSKMIYFIIDNKEYLEKLKTIVADFDYKIFSNPLEGVREVIKTPPQLVITTPQMEKMKGIELVKHIRFEAIVGDTPIMMYLSSTDEVDIEDYFDNGVNDCILDSCFNPKLTILRIRNMISSFNKTKDVQKMIQMVNLSPANIMLADLNGKLIYLNEKSKKTLRSLELLLPVKVDEMIGKNIDIFHSSEIPQMIISSAQNLPYSSQIVLGTETLELNIFPLFDQYNNYIGPMVSWEVITDRLVAEELKDQLNTERARFLRVLCHDILNPITAIKGLYDILNKVIKDIENEKVHDILFRIGKSINRIQDILSSTRERLSVEDSRKEILLVPYKISELLMDIKLLAEGLMASKKIIFETNVQNHDLEFICEPQSTINQVFLNILSNAFKFTQENGKILFSVENDDEDVIFKIRDSGIGIPEELRPTLFDSTETTSRVGTSGEQGIGYGLPLVKSYIKSYGGSIEIFSQDIEQFPEDHWTEVILKLKKA
ncbi:MAG: hybrid sensor histidine kinase/response regulator [Halobacteriovoraceae bacterium]|nr:hybrid sensor histidine kinase/response regulator [Halobacteriovoraceae bacterium]